MPVAQSEKATHFVKSMGGSARILAEARRLHKADKPRLALEYLDLLVASENSADEAKALKSEILMQLAGQTTHGITRKMYQRLSKMELD